MPEIKALDDLRLITNLIRGFCVCRTILCYDRKMFPFIKTLKRNEVLTGLRADFKIDVLPVTADCILRADFKNRHFARNREAGFTGRFQKSTFCP